MQFILALHFNLVPLIWLFGGLATYQGELGVAPRLAHWQELRGHPEDARRLLRQAAAEADRRHGVPREQVAWFHLRLGDLALRTGHLAEAERELDAGLRIAPADYRLLGTLARLDAYVTNTSSQF